MVATVKKKVPGGAKLGAEHDASKLFLVALEGRGALKLDGGQSFRAPGLS